VQVWLLVCASGPLEGSADAAQVLRGGRSNGLPLKLGAHQPEIMRQCRREGLITDLVAGRASSPSSSCDLVCRMGVNVGGTARGVDRTLNVRADG